MLSLLIIVALFGLQYWLAGLFPLVGAKGRTYRRTRIIVGIKV